MCIKGRGAGRGSIAIAMLGTIVRKALWAVALAVALGLALPWHAAGAVRNASAHDAWPACPTQRADCPSASSHAELAPLPARKAAAPLPEAAPELGLPGRSRGARALARDARPARGAPPPLSVPLYLVNLRLLR